MYTSVIKTGLLTFSLLAASVVQAAQLPEFQAKFEVEALGLTLGKANHSLSCEQQNCTLVSDAKPSGFAANFFKDTSTETIKLTQTADQLIWQSYHKLGTYQKDGKTQHKSLSLTISDNNQVICLEKQRQWPVKEKMFDLMSIAYGIQHAAINKQTLNDFILVDSNFQEKLHLKNQNNNDYIELEFSDDELDAVKYHFISPHTEIELWLLPKYNYFPGKIRLINREEKTITLSLAEPPKIL